MNKHNVCVPIACAGALALLFAPPSVAQDGQPAIPRVEVRHTLPVTVACPSVHAQLAQQLARAWSTVDVDGSGEFRVDFQLAGNQVNNVHVGGGNFDFRAPLRRAVRNLTCSSPDSTSYAVRFVVKVVDQDDAGSHAS